jgi:hypothetical protein
MSQRRPAPSRNTSFADSHPIVNTPCQAIGCFLRTEMHVLAIGPCLLLKSNNVQVTGSRDAFAGTEK